MNNPKEKPKLLVIGSAIKESITHSPENISRKDIGGVAGQMATGLGLNGADVTILTNFQEGSEGDQIIQMLKEAGVKVIASTRTPSAGWANISTIQGEMSRCQGSWPNPTGITTDLRELIKDFDWLITDCNHSQTDIIKILWMANQASVPVVMNATTTGKSIAILRANEPKRIVTMNRAEARNIMSKTRVRHEIELTDALNTEALLITDSSRGWKLYGRARAFMSSPAVPVPPNTDFIGCGDYATAGLTQAIAEKIPIKETINALITLKLNRNTIKPIQPELH